MLVGSSERLKSLERRASEIGARIQRLEEAQAALKASLERARRVSVLVASIAAAAQAEPAIGLAMKNFARAMRSPRPRGRLGG